MNTTNFYMQVTQAVVVRAPRYGISVLMLLAFWIGGIVALKSIRRINRRADANTQDVMELLGRVAKGALIVIGVVLALSNAGADVSALVASLGLTGFALGFALKDAVSNLLSGILIILYRPFKRGDQISCAGFEGKVVAIDLRYTTLAADGKTFLVPNMTVFNNTIAIVKAQPPAP